ncbi:hypothetical protein [Micromonospora sp. NPDC048843]|uniref:hypothetical protein n=1 Tax=Micromonospora sp. NPDC048843 TaxID=3155389 RepID=UPI0033C161F6
MRPQDDLYRNVNGTWLRTYQLPPDKVSYSTFSEVSDRIEGQLRQVIDDIHNPDRLVHSPAAPIQPAAVRISASASPVISATRAGG